MELGECPELVSAVARVLTYKDLGRCCAINRLWRREGELEKRTRRQHWIVECIIDHQDHNFKMTDVSSPSRMQVYECHMDFPLELKDKVSWYPTVLCSGNEGKLLIYLRNGYLALGDPFKNKWEIVSKYGYDCALFAACISPTNLLLLRGDGYWKLIDLNNGAKVLSEPVETQSWGSGVVPRRFIIQNWNIVWAGGAFYTCISYESYDDPDIVEEVQLAKYDTSKMAWEEVYVELPPYAPQKKSSPLLMWPVSYHGKLLLYLDYPISQLMEAVFDDGNRCTLLPCDWFDTSNLSKLDIEVACTVAVFGKDDAIFFLSYDDDFHYVLGCFRKDLNSWFALPPTLSEPSIAEFMRYFVSTS